MLPKQHRLDRKDFDLVFKKGRRIRGKNFSLVVLAAGGRNEECKIGVVVSKKVFKKAVDRNKLKRQIRSILKRQSNNDLLKGKKVVVMAYPFSKPPVYREMKEELLDIMQKIT